MPDDLVASAEACTILNIHRSTLSRWVQLGKLTPAMQLPSSDGKGAMLFNRADVLRLAAEYTEASA
jgi:predicted site-specific integrase-resolvase